MKLAFIIHSLSIGGAETVAVEYLLKLKKLGQEVCLIEFSHTESFLYDKLKDNNIRVITLTKLSRGLISKVCNKVFRRFIICKRLNKLLKNEKFDILHIHTGVGEIRYLNFEKNKVFYSFHTSVERNLSVLGSRHRKNLMRFAHEGMNFFVLSNEMVLDAQRVLPTDKIYKLSNGLDFEEIRRNRYDRKIFFDTLGIPENVFVLCHVARMHPVKNHIKTIEIFKEIIKKRSNAYLLLIGQTEETILSKMNVLIDKYALKDRVMVLGNRTDATAILSVCDAMVLPSFMEGFPLVAIEAQVLGIRSVFSDVVPEEVMCNDNCFALNVNDSDEEWAKYLLGDFLQAHLYKLDDLNIDIVVNKLLNYYRQA